MSHLSLKWRNFLEVEAASSFPLPWNLPLPKSEERLLHLSLRSGEGKGIFLSWGFQETQPNTVFPHSFSRQWRKVELSLPLLDSQNSGKQGKYLSAFRYLWGYRDLWRTWKMSRDHSPLGFRQGAFTYKGNQGNRVLALAYIHHLFLGGEGWSSI